MKRWWWWWKRLSHGGWEGYRFRLVGLETSASKGNLVERPWLASHLAPSPLPSSHPLPTAPATGRSALPAASQIRTMPNT